MAAKPPGEGKFKAPPERTPKITSPPSYRLMYLVMVLVAVVILAVGYVFYHFQEHQMRQRIKDGLSIMAQLKAAQIAEWRAEKLVDANILVGSPFFAEGVEKYMASPADTEAKEKILVRLAIIEKAYPYQDILLVDLDGNVLLSLNDSVNSLSDTTLAQLKVAIKEHKAVFTDFHYPTDSNAPCLNVIAPLFLWGQDSPQAMGAVVFCMDPSRYLYPLLQSSPMPTETAETLLVERDGDQVLFLNELRHQKDTALKLRIPLSQQEVPAVMAVLGKEGVVEGKDYRGVEVLAALEHVSDSPWYMVTKIDTSEVLAAWRYQAGMIMAFFAGLLVAALAGIGFIWQRRQRLAYQALYQVELESQALRSHFEYLVRYANDIILLVDESQDIVEVNDRALEAYGYTREEMLGMPLVALMPPGDLYSYQARLRKIQQEGAIVAEGIHQRKDGSTFPVEISGRTIKIEDKKYLQGIVRDITERKAKEEEYRAIISTTIDGFWQTDMQGRFLDVNEAYCNMIGYSRDELLNMAIMDIEAIEKPRETTVRIRKVKEVGYDRFESRHRCKNGEFIDVGISINYLPIDGGRMFVFIRDITERKKMERESRASEERFRIAAASASDLIWDWDIPSGRLDWHGGIDEILGYGQGEFPRTIDAWGKAIHADDIGRVNATLDGHLKEDTPYNEEYRIKRKDGDYLYWEDRGVALRDDNGQPYRMIGACSDITERKRAEMSLQESENRYRAIVGNAYDGIILQEASGSILTWNNAAARIFGITEGEALGHTSTSRNWSTIREDGSEFPGAEHPSMRTLATGEPCRNVTMGIKRASGEISWVNINTSPLFREGEAKPYAVVISFSDITERKRAEEAMRESEVKYRTVAEQSLLGLIVIQDFRVVFANAALAEISGFSVEELLSLPWEKVQALVHPEDQALVWGRLQERLGGKPVPDRYEYRSVRKDGEVRWLEMHASRTEYGGKPAVQGAIMDITERKRAEEVLRESEEKFHSIFDNSADAMLLTIPDGGIIAANPVACRMFGYTDEEFRRYGRNAIIDASDPRLNAALEQRARTGKFEGELTFKRKDGTRLPGEISSVAFKDKDGQDRTSMVIRDLTERKRAEGALRRSEEKYRTILNEIYEVYYELDLAGNYTFFNDALCRQTGYSREELMGMNYRKYTPEEDRESVYEKFNRVYRTGEPLRGVPFRSIAKDGRIFYTEDTVLPLRNESGGIIGFRGLSRDVTERRKAEEERRQMELKAQVTSRLASVGEMAAGVAHEINNPLTAVTGYAQLLMDREGIPQDMRSDLEAINDGAQRVAGIVQRLLAFSRQTRPERKLVDINELIESTLILRAYHLKVNNIEVTTKLAADLLETVIDPGQIQQVLLNLIVNAETAMQLAHGKGKLTITTEKNHNTIKICIEDDGPGIEPEVMNWIFDPFFTTREVGQGTGLGLSLCYGIVMEHKGRIYVESQPGKGAKFIVELPVITEAVSPKPAEPVAKKPQKKVKARILVVDDEQVVREVVNRVLTGEGHKVETVDNAAEALKKIRSRKYRLILVDIKMPGMSGVELYKRIQKIDKSLAWKVVFITGDVMGADTEKFLAEAKVGHIEKPFDAERLIREVHRALTRGR